MIEKYSYSFASNFNNCSIGPSWSQFVEFVNRTYKSFSNAMDITGGDVEPLDVFSLRFPRANSLNGLRTLHYVTFENPQ